MGEKKKIALLAASWDEKMIAGTVKGIKRKLSTLGWDLHVLLCFPAFGIENPDNYGAYNIFSLADASDYEGLLLAINVIQGLDMVKHYFPQFVQKNKKIVSLDLDLPDVTSVVPNGYDAVYRLVSHLIEEHHCKTLNYVGGAESHPDNIIRKKAFMAALLDHDIAPEIKRIRDYHFVEDDGKKAYNEFKKEGLHLPDAVVCANDAMAVGYCQEADMDGYYPPADFLITGYDNDLNSIEFAPQITSVDRNAEELGYQGCDALLKLIAGEEIPQMIHYQNALLFRGSCGCYSKNEIREQNRIVAQRLSFVRLKEERRFYQMVGGLRQNLALATTESMFSYYLHDALKSSPIYGFSFCVNQEVYFSSSPVECTFQPGYSSKMYSISGVKEGIRLDDKHLFPVKRLYPPYLDMDDDTTHVYMFSPIQRVGQNMGYFVFADPERLLGSNFILNLTSAGSNAYSNLRNLLNLQQLNKWLDGAYTKDATTQLYNRFGYMKVGYEMFAKSKAYESPLLVMFMDMDHLKYINDTYGHSQGDIALSMFANALKKVVGTKKIAIRYGGDEFLILGPVSDKRSAKRFKERLERELAATNERENLPFQVEASIGYIITDPKSSRELDEYVAEADELMYEVKKQNKKDRGSNYYR